jgi:hypothetical protein
LANSATRGAGAHVRFAPNASDPES